MYPIRLSTEIILYFNSSLSHTYLHITEEIFPHIKNNTNVEFKINEEKKQKDEKEIQKKQKRKKKKRKMK